MAAGAFLFLVVACSDDGINSELPAPTSSTPSGDTDIETTQTTLSAPNPQEAVQAWVEMWDGAELVVTDPDAARDVIGAVASEAVYEQLVRIYNPTVEGENPSTPRVFDNNPVGEEQSDGTVVIDDCLFESPRAGNRTIWYQSTASDCGSAWRIEGVEVVNQIGWVPRAMADAAFQGYEDYWDASWSSGIRRIRITRSSRRRSLNRSGAHPRPARPVHGRWVRGPGASGQPSRGDRGALGDRSGDSRLP